MLELTAIGAIQQLEATQTQICEFAQLDGLVL